jgi:hypothetical protein
MVKKSNPAVKAFADFEGRDKVSTETIRKVKKATTPSQRNAIMGTQPSVPTPSQRNAIMGTQPSVPTFPNFEGRDSVITNIPGLTSTSTNSTPPVPQTTQTSSNLVTKASVKIATPQYVNFDENVLNPITESDITSLFFEQVAGHELLILSNKNFVNTKNVDYQPIANISNFKNTYDPKKIIALQDTSDVYFFNFAINLLARIPDVPTDSSTNGTNVYITASGDLVIETKDNAPDERIQVEIISGGTINTDILGVN